jgi:hypothetical protein
MTRLFNSRGNHIANLQSGRLYAPSGQNIGRQVSNGDIVDMNGSYLGEIVNGNRLLRRSGRGNTGSLGMRDQQVASATLAIQATSGLRVSVDTRTLIYRRSSIGLPA